jgi:glycosyltransferase involved in cell wall biosynthesis
MSITRDSDIELILIEDVGISGKNDIDDAHERQNIIEYCDLYSQVSAGNPGTARNFGIEKSRGKWIAFWDEDDLPILERFVAMVREAEFNKCRVAIGNFTVQLSSGENTHVDSAINLTLSLDLSKLATNPGIWRMAFDREYVVGTNRFPASSMGEDRAFISQLQIFEYSIWTSSDTVYSYVKNNVGSLTNTPKNAVDSWMSLNSLNLSPNDMKNKGQRIFTSVTLINLLNSGARSGVNRGYFFWNAIQVVLKPRNTWLVIEGCRLRVRQVLRDRKPEYIRIELAGGLGNQLFQYAHALESGVPIQIYGALGNPRLNQLNSPEIASFELPDFVKFIDSEDNSIIKIRMLNLILRIDGAIGQSSHMRVLKELATRCLKATIWLSNLRKDGRIPDQFLLAVGYYQNSNWMNSPRVSHFLRCMKVYNEKWILTDATKMKGGVPSAMLHVRHGDYVLEDKFGCLPHTYYTEAISRLESQFSIKKFFVFSDDIEFAKNLLAECTSSEVNYVSSDQYTPAQTLELMRNFDAYILANSSFSWWAAALRRNVSAPVMAPYPWFVSINTSQDFYPTDWTLLSR